MKKLRNILLLAIVMVAAFSLTGCGKTTIDLNKYITIKSEGHDKVGTASYTFDEEAFKNDYADKIEVKSTPNEEIALESRFGESPWEILKRYCIKCDLDKKMELSNGDTVTLKWDNDDNLAEEAFGVKFKYSDIEQKVEKLKESTELNPFDYKTVEFSGETPNGQANIVSIENKEQIPAMNDVEFSFDKSRELKEGDQIKVTAFVESDEEFANEYGMVLSETEKTYTVPKLNKYITEVSEIPEDVKNAMDTQLKEGLQEKFNDTWYNYDLSKKLEDVKFVGNYVLSLKDETNAYSWHARNYIYFVYKVKAYDSDENKELNYYWRGYFKDVILTTDGQCEYDKENSNPLDFDDDEYTDLNSFYQREIVGNLDEYQCKENIQEQ